jgi:hypothetical protein
VTGAAADADAVPFRSTSNTSLQEPHLGRVAARPNFPPYEKKLQGAAMEALFGESHHLKKIKAIRVSLRRIAC